MLNRIRCSEIREMLMMTLSFLNRNKTANDETDFAHETLIRKVRDSDKEFTSEDFL